MWNKGPFCENILMTCDFGRFSRKYLFTQKLSRKYLCDRANACECEKFAASEKMRYILRTQIVRWFSRQYKCFGRLLRTTFATMKCQTKFRNMVTNFVSNTSKQKTKLNFNKKKSSADQNAVSNIRSSEVTIVQACLLAITEVKSEFSWIACHCATVETSKR